MKKNKALSISIPQPCSVPLHEMTAVEGGRYCSQCEKTVIDFSTLTDRELYSRMSELQGKAACGIFRKDQIDRQIIEPIPPRRNFIPVAALLSGLLLGTQAAPSQEFKIVDSTEQVVRVNDNTDTTTKKSETDGKSICIQGKVTEGIASTPLANAIVSLQDENNKILGYALSDEEGGYCIEVAVMNNDSNLFIHAVHDGYCERVIEVCWNEEGIILDIQLSKVLLPNVSTVAITNMYMMGGFALVTRYPVSQALVSQGWGYPHDIVYVKESERVEPINFQPPVEQAVTDGTSIGISESRFPLERLPAKHHEEDEAIPQAVVPTNSQSRNSNEDDDDNDDSE